MARIIDCQQGTQEWHEARCGIITASRVHDILAKTSSGKPTAARRNYQAELVVERLTGHPTEGGFVSSEMRRGTEVEPEARNLYELTTGNLVEQVGFVIAEDTPYAGASPDGLVGLDGCVEIKCPNTANHLQLFEGGRIESRYYDQMQWVMFVCDRTWCDYISYDPRISHPALQLYIQRVERDEAWISRAQNAALQFNVEVEERLAQLQNLAATKGAQL